MSSVNYVQVFQLTYSFPSRYQTAEQQKKWLEPLLNGEIRSAFAMTEKGISSSDATNISGSITRDGDDIIINAHKQWISGAGDPRNKIHVCLLLQLKELLGLIAHLIDCCRQDVRPDLTV